MAKEIKQIPLEDIYFDEEFNCRGKIIPMDVADLAKDIESRGGLIQPVTVTILSDEEKKKRGIDCNYFLVAGFRRYTAHKVLRWKKIDATVNTDIDSISGAQILNLAENFQRKNLTVLQEAKALEKLRKVGVGEFQAAEQLNKSRGWIQVRYMLLQLPEEIQHEIDAGFINQTQIRELYSILKTSGQSKTYEAAKALKEAKKKGQAKSVNPKRKQKKSKAIRQPPEIKERMQTIQQSIGNGIHTRALAWAIGEISNQEFDEDLKEYAEKQGKTYIPQQDS